MSGTPARKPPKGPSSRRLSSLGPLWRKQHDPPSLSRLGGSAAFRSRSHPPPSSTPLGFRVDLPPSLPPSHGGKFHAGGYVPWSSDITSVRRRVPRIPRLSQSSRSTKHFQALARRSQALAGPPCEYVKRLRPTKGGTLGRPKKEPVSVFTQVSATYSGLRAIFSWDPTGGLKCFKQRRTIKAKTRPRTHDFGSFSRWTRFRS